MGTRQIKDLILELRSRGTTVLLSSHLLADVEDICDRIAILYGGRLQAEGTVSELLADADRQLIETDRLDSRMIEKIKSFVAEGGKAVHDVTSPRQSLEAFFLKTVEEAREQGIETSGSTPERPAGELVEKGTLISPRVDAGKLMDEMQNEAWFKSR
jgi:ABC-2 type transport system ATP-binding protein